MQLLSKVLLLLCLSLPLLGQSPIADFGNEWIQPNQTYYKFQIAEDGLYRIPIQHLMQSGIPVSAVNPSEWQLFFMGEEIPIHIHKQAGQIAYIEFHGRKNRANLDYSLHADSSALFNPEVSLITDSAAYFLSWKSGAQGLRYQNRSANLSNLPSPIPYYTHQAKANLPLQWQEGKRYAMPGYRLSKSSFEYGEGWGTPPQIFQNHNISADKVYPNGPDAQLEVRIHSTYAYLHHLQIIHNNQPKANYNFSNDTLLNYTVNLPLSNLSNNNNIAVRGLNGNTDQHSISQLTLSYPRLFDFGGSSQFYFELPESNQRQALEIDNFNSNGQEVYLFDLTTAQRIHCFWDGAKVRTDLGPSAVKRQFLLIDLSQTQQIKTVGHLEEVIFRNFQQLQADYIIISHPQLFQDNDGKNPVLEYAAYRASRGFQPLVIDVQELYDQFAYGLNKHPQALRNFKEYILKNWSNPQYIFLIGKGRNYQEVKDLYTYDHLIPSFGYPSSDQLLFAKKNQTSSDIAVGRLAATSGDQVRAYLNKIIRTELAQQTDRQWLKKVVHLSGGVDNYEQNYFQNVLSSCQNIAENSDWAAQVSRFSPQNQEPSALSSFELLDSLSQEGIALISYLGHAFPHKVDVDFSPLMQPRSNDKFPAIFSFSCSNGNLFSNQQQMSEDFIFAENAGAVFYMGFVHPISLGSADFLSNEFYQNATEELGIATSIQKSIYQLENQEYFGDFTEMACQFISCHGDPAFRFSPIQGPDFHIKNIKAPLQIEQNADFISLELEIENLGLVVDSILFVRIYRQEEDGTEKLLLEKNLSYVRRNKVYQLDLPIGHLSNSSALDFIVRLDPENQIAEYPSDAAEQNNQANFSVALLGSRIQAIYPQNFAISSQPELQLKAFVDYHAASNEYELEVDTIATFNSPYLIQTALQLMDGELNYSSNLSLEDSVVYYWRLRLKGEMAWASFSFIHLNPQLQGWNQSTTTQLKENELNQMVWQAAHTTYNNGVKSTSLRYTDFGPYLYQQFAEYDKCRCSEENGIYVHVVNPADLQAWQLPAGSNRYGARNCDAANRRSLSFLFETDLPNKQLALERFLKDSIPSGYYILLYSLNNASANNWPTSLISHLEAQGASQTEALLDGQGPWAFFYQKDELAFPYRAESSSPAGLEAQYPQEFNLAYMQSPRIGPAIKWDSLHWSIQNNITNKDSRLNVYAWNPEGEKIIIYQDIKSHSFELSDLDANKFPYIQLEWKKASNEQLDFWRVFYQRSADLKFVDHPADWEISYQTDDQIQIHLNIKNQGLASADSSILTYHIKQTNIHGQLNVMPLASGQSSIIHLPIIPLEGLEIEHLELELALNSDYTIKEEYYSNNFLRLNAEFKQKAIQPQMEVLVNQKEQENGIILTSTNQLNVEINDPSTLLNLGKLEDFQIKIIPLNQQMDEKTLITGSAWVNHFDLDWTGENKKQNYLLELEMQLPAAGKYKLVIEPLQNDFTEEMTPLYYELEFLIPEKSQIGQLKAFPNPMQTQTTFSFEWQGPETPEQVLIDIINLEGKRVHQINIPSDLLEQGLVQIQWDGLDASGQELAAGYYVYQLKTKEKGLQTLSNYGKLIIVR